MSKIRPFCVLLFVINSLVSDSLVRADDSFTITPIVVEGDPVAGVGDIDFIDNVAINNSGDWFVEANTSFPNADEDQVLLKNGDVFSSRGNWRFERPSDVICRLI